MKVTPLPRETTDSLLHRYLGKFNDELEKEFYKLNPHARTHYFLPSSTYVLPLLTKQTVKTRRSPWN